MTGTSFAVELRSETVVMPLEVARLEVDQSVNCYLTGMGTLEVVPVMAYLLRAAGKHYLVDAGPPEEAYCAEHHRPLVPGSRRDLSQLLSERGVDGLDGVVMTHLHWDHAGGLCTLGYKGPVFVQRSEVEYAASPLPAHRGAYLEAVPMSRRPWWESRKFELLDGDAVIGDGVQVLHTPGHSPGSQCVLVQEAGQVVAVAGDTVPTPKNFVEGVPCGVHTSLGEWYVSFGRLRSAASAVYPGHGAKVERALSCSASGCRTGMAKRRPEVVRQRP
jgi:glyoxylase-like metal-dependent hydrolase (beta-lactamase superfamily II)